MGGATQGDDVDVKSCIAFMNTVDKSKNMAADLQTDRVKDWVVQVAGCERTTPTGERCPITAWNTLTLPAMPPPARDCQDAPSQKPTSD